VAGLEPFARLGIRSDHDLLLHLPLRYEDLSQVLDIASTMSGETSQVEGVVRTVRTDPPPRRALRVEIADETGALVLRFLHYNPTQAAQFKPGLRVRVHGEIRASLLGREIVHPRYRIVTSSTPLAQTLHPVYPTVAGIGQGLIRAAVSRALRQMRLPETVPAPLIAPLRLPALADALKWLHAPPVGTSAQALEERTPLAWQRVILDELLAQQLSLRRARAERASQRAEALGSQRVVEQLLAHLPFSLTAAQQRAWREISEDLAGEQPMNRLLQGDVGSGKTVVAALAACQAIGSGAQVALMAPTEILAEQHLHKLGPWLERIGLKVGWLVGSMRESARKATRAAIAAGELDLVVGTHALIEQSVAFARLGLSIVDEQHRFGVAQRLALRTRQGGLAHQLMMSATPIPRTLAMSYYADLDVSVIDQLPPGRTPVLTRLVSDERREEVIERVRQAALGGRQVYWVCPLIEESEALELQTAIDTHAALSEALAPLGVGLVHGRLPPADKQAVMQAFSSGTLPVLVATTVIEVGVDVPNASLMVIEHAERFGLAQLHQLRGRVGRGSAQSACVLMYRGPLSLAARHRLKAMRDTNDGFEIARLDLKVRGPGEFLGARQSGQALLRFADLERDADRVEQARDMALRMLRDHPEDARRHVERWMGQRAEFLKA
jgi:ATP-dependent DNA helicase RecG